MNKYKHLVSSSKDYMALFNTESVCKAINPNFANALDKRQKHLLGEKIDRFFDTNFYGKELAGRIQQCLHGEDVYFQAWLSLPGTGDEKYLDFGLFPNHDETGRKPISGYTVIIRDATKRKIFEDSNAKRLNNDSIKNIVGGVGSYFKNIFSAILGYSELLSANLSTRDDDSNEWFETLFRICNEQHALCRDFLLFDSREETEPAPVDLSRIAKECLELSGADTATDIHISSEISPELSVNGDAEQLRLMILYIVSNCIKAMEDSSGRLSVRLDEESPLHVNSEHRSDSPEKYAKLYIEDNRKVFAEEMSEFIKNRTFDCSGFKLALAKEIVSNHNGVMTISRGRDSGAVFEILIPVSSELDAIEEKNKKLLPRGTETVLLVDDDPSLVQLEKKIVESLGYRVEMATDPVTALKRIRQGGVDVLLTDFTMPRMNGDVLIREAKAVAPQIHCMILSGYSEKIDVDKITSELNCKLVYKPCNVSEIAYQIRELIDNTW